MRTREWASDSSRKEDVKMPSGNKPAFLKPGANKANGKMEKVKDNKMSVAKSGGKKK